MSVSIIIIIIIIIELSRQKSALFRKFPGGQRSCTPAEQISGDDSAAGPASLALRTIVFFASYYRSL
jgi:hypothetical protein